MKENIIVDVMPEIIDFMTTLGQKLQVRDLIRDKAKKLENYLLSVGNHLKQYDSSKSGNKTSIFTPLLAND